MISFFREHFTKRNAEKFQAGGGMGNSPHRRNLSDSVKQYPMAKPKSKPPERERVISCPPQDIRDQLRELDVGLRALKLQVKAEKIRRQRRTKAARKKTKL